MRSIRRMSVVAILAIPWCALVGGCGQRQASSQDAGVARKQEELAALETKRQATIQELKGLTVPELAERLGGDSDRGVEPFNSMAFTELVSRGASAVAPLSAALKTPRASSLLALLALRRLSPEAYKAKDETLRARILLDALRSSKFFNTWGLPHVEWEEAAKAMIEEGSTVESGLVALLDDKREARVWGSEGATEAARYGYRVCDYAWALLSAIRGEPATIPVDPAERDRLIETAKR